jgi:hypothetical protein
VPRRTPEDIAAAYLRTGGKAPEPPAHLDAKSKQVWRIIASSRPPDFFTAGSLPLLEAYVVALVMLRFYHAEWCRDQTNDGYLKAITALNNSLATLATKLRLSISSIDKRSGLLTEKGDPPSSEDGKVIHDVLFGGGVRKF